MKIKLTPAGKRFFNTKKLHASLIVTDKPVTLSNGYWDGGSRSEYWNIMKTGNVVRLSYPTSPREYGGGEPPKVAPTEQLAIVQSGTFRGKEATPTLYVVNREWFPSELGTEVV